MGKFKERHIEQTQERSKFYFDGSLLTNNFYFCKQNSGDQQPLKKRGDTEKLYE